MNDLNASDCVGIMSSLLVAVLYTWRDFSRSSELETYDRIARQSVYATKTLAFLAARACSSASERNWRRLDRILYIPGS